MIALCVFQLSEEGSPRLSEPVASTKGVRILLFRMDSAGSGQPDSTKSTANYRLSSNYIKICPWWLPWQDSSLPKEGMICLWKSSLKAKATEWLCWVDPY